MSFTGVVQLYIVVYGYILWETALEAEKNRSILNRIFRPQRVDLSVALASVGGNEFTVEPR